MSATRPTHLLAVWNPSYADDAMDAHLRVLLRWAERRDRGEAAPDDVYVWWAKLRSPRREGDLPHVDDVLALNDQITAGVETHLCSGSASTERCVGTSPQAHATSATARMEIEDALEKRRMLCLLALPNPGIAQDRAPILDMHMHAMRATDMGPPPMAICAPFEGWPTWGQQQPYGATFMQAFKNPTCAKPVWSAETDEALMRETIDVMERRNIVGVLGGTPDMVATWRDAAAERFIPGLTLNAAAPDAVSPDSLRTLVEGGSVAVLGEVIKQYAGVAPTDERMAPYWDLAEELDIPVGIHVGPGPPGATYLATPGYRAQLSSPLTLEPVLAEHPGLRVYAMHAGFPFIDDLLAMLYAHPQLHVDIAVIAYTQPKERFYRYLERIVEAGFVDRVMWGSDQMVWPGTIEHSIRTIEEAPFLTEAQKRAILYDNAARFLRLTEEEMARHRAM